MNANMTFTAVIAGNLHVMQEHLSFGCPNDRLYTNRKLNYILYMYINTGLIVVHGLERTTNKQLILFTTHANILDLLYVTQVIYVQKISMHSCCSECMAMEVSGKFFT